MNLLRWVLPCKTVTESWGRTGLSWLWAPEAKRQGLPASKADGVGATSEGGSVMSSSVSTPYTGDRDKASLSSGSDARADSSIEGPPE